MEASEIDEILKYDPAKKEVKTEPEDPVIGEILKHDPDKPIVENQEPEQDNSDLSWKQALVEGFQNIPSSAKEYGKNLFKGIISPKKTGETLGKIVGGGIEKLKEGEHPYEKNFDAFVEMIKGRYGSIDNFKKTIAEDPVGLLGDISTIETGIGGTAKLAGTMSKTSKLAKAGETAAKIGMASEPINLARSIAALPLKLVPEKVPVNMYQQAVKFGTTVSAQERLAFTRTALKAENQIMPTMKGMEKLRDKIDSLNKQVNTLINQSADKGTKIDINKAYAGLDSLRDEFKRISDEPLVWDREFSKIKKQWSEAVNIGDTRTPVEIQKMKTRIYKELESLYEKQKATPAKAEFRKAIARNARGMIEDIIPEVKQLNKKEGDLIELWDAIESKANRITNRDIISIGLPIKMGTGSGIGYMLGAEKGAAVGTALGFALGVFDTPQVKSKIALVISRLKEKGITVKPTSAAIKLGLFQSGRAEEKIGDTANEEDKIEPQSQ